MQQGYNMFPVSNNNNYTNATSPAGFLPDPDKPTFSVDLNNKKTPEQIWYNANYPFTMNRHLLIMNSDKSKSNNPRSLNSFIIYARNEGNKPKYNNMQARYKNTIIARLWNDESLEVRDVVQK